MNNAQRIHLIDSISMQIRNLRAISNIVYALGHSRDTCLSSNVLGYTSELIAQVSVALEELEKSLTSL